MNMQNYQAVVNAGQLLLIDKTMDDSQVRDVLTSQLYAQLAADYATPKFDDFAQWTTTFVEAQKRFGWAFPLESEDVVVEHSPRFSVAQLIANSLPTLNRQGCCEQLFQRLRALPLASPALQVLARNTCAPVSSDRSAAGGPSTWVVCMVAIVSPGPVIEFTGLSLRTRQRPLPDPWTGQFDTAQLEGKIQRVVSIARLQEIMYAPVRLSLEEAIEAEAPAHTFILADA